MQSSQLNKTRVIVQMVVGLAVFAAMALVVAALGWWSLLLVILAITVLCGSGYCCVCGYHRWRGRGLTSPPETGDAE